MPLDKVPIRQAGSTGAGVWALVCKEIAQKAISNNVTVRFLFMGYYFYVSTNILKKQSNHLFFQKIFANQKNPYLCSPFQKTEAEDKFFDSTKRVILGRGL